MPVPGRANRGDVCDRAETGTREAVSGVGYVEKVMQPNERILHSAKLHWMIYARPLLRLLLALLIVLAVQLEIVAEEVYAFLVMAAGVILILASLIEFLLMMIRQMTTEIAVTDRRVIRKAGFLTRETEEMNIQQVESVEIHQNLFAKLFDYGTVQMNGTGHGLERIAYVRDPLGLRSAITAR